MQMPNRDRFTAGRLTARYCEVVGQEPFVAIAGSRDIGRGSPVMARQVYSAAIGCTVPP